MLEIIEMIGEKSITNIYRSRTIGGAGNDRKQGEQILMDNAYWLQLVAASGLGTGDYDVYQQLDEPLSRTLLAKYWLNN